MAGLRIGDEPVPFELFGLAGSDLVPRTVAAVGRRAAPGGGMRIEHVALSHGDRSRPPRRWAVVGVTGPLHWAAEGRVASMDPLPMIASELLTAAGHAFETVEAVQAQTDALLARGFAPVELDLDAEPKRFGMLREGEHWAAIRHIAPVHLLYVVASNVAPEEVRLHRLADLSDYGT